MVGAQEMSTAVGWRRLKDMARNRNQWRECYDLSVKLVPYKILRIRHKDHKMYTMEINEAKCLTLPFFASSFFA